MRSRRLNWEGRALQQPEPIGSKHGVITWADWVCDDRYIAASVAFFKAKEHHIGVWHADDGNMLHLLKRHEFSISGISRLPLSPSCFVSSSYDGRVVVWDALSGKLLKEFVVTPNETFVPNDAFENAPLDVLDMCVHPEGHAFYCLDLQGGLNIFSLIDKLGISRQQRSQYLSLEFDNLVQCVQTSTCLFFSRLHFLFQVLSLSLFLSLIVPLLFFSSYSLSYCASLSF